MLPKYSWGRSKGVPGEPASVAVAGKLTPRDMRVVALPSNWFALIRTGTRALAESRA